MREGYAALHLRQAQRGTVVPLTMMLRDFTGCVEAGRDLCRPPACLFVYV